MKNDNLDRIDKILLCTGYGNGDHNTEWLLSTTDTIYCFRDLETGENFWWQTRGNYPIYGQETYYIKAINRGKNWHGTKLTNVKAFSTKITGDGKTIPSMEIIKNSTYGY